MVQQYVSQEVIRGCVRPGMFVRHKGITWKASANTRGKLVISTLRDSAVIRHVFVEILLDSHGDPLGEFNKAEHGLIHSSHINHFITDNDVIRITDFHRFSATEFSH
jgi:hypothetical protein